MKYWLFGLMLVTGVGQAENEIISTAIGLTLASTEIKGSIHTVAVIEDKENVIWGLDVSALSRVPGDPVTVYAQLGYQNIQALIDRAPRSDWIELSYEQLLSPAGGASHHLALGLNYQKHATEVGAQEQPFMFIKGVRPSREQSIRFDPVRLLDYEVELCARPLQNISSEEKGLREFGFFVCGDFTDRATLFRELDVGNIQSGKGFSAAKSFARYFPTGPYMVIPLDSEEFLKRVYLSLVHNGKNKQEASVSEMVWDLEKALNHLLGLSQSGYPTHSVIDNWLPEGKLTQGMTILTGTPDGVIMRPPSIWFKMSRGAWYFLGLKFMGDYASPREYVIERFLADQFRGKRFLQQGDELVLSATWMGELRVAIE